MSRGEAAGRTKLPGRKMKKISTSLVTFSCCFALLLSGCARYSDLPSGTVKKIDIPALSPIVDREAISVPVAELKAPPSTEYRIGPNDVLYININGRPEFLVIGTNQNSKIQGSRVDGSGNIQLPIVGPVHVAGLSLSQAQEKIRKSLRTYLKDPWVVVEIAEYRSHPLYLLGQFRASGTYYMDRPLTLLQGIALGNGFDANADLRGARLNRNNRIMAVDVHDLLLNGSSNQNVWLQPGDTIFIPDNRNQVVFVFGAVKKPGPVPMLQGGLNLAQAIATAELRDVGYDFRHVRIIRSLSVTRGELLVVDFDKILRGKALPLQLAAGDIIYVPKSIVGSWNDVINEMLPTLQAVSAVLQPFVNIKFLSED